MDERIKNFDCQENLKEVIESGIPMPKGIDPQVAYQICSNELRKIDYTPKSESKTL